VRIKDLELVREAYVAMQKYSDLKDNPGIRRQAKENIKRLLSPKEYSFVIHGVELNAE